MSLALSPMGPVRPQAASKHAGTPAPGKLVLAVLGHVLLFAAVIWLNRATLPDVGGPAAVPLRMIFQRAPAPAAPAPSSKPAVAAQQPPAPPVPAPPPPAPVVPAAAPAPPPVVPMPTPTIPIPAPAPQTTPLLQRLPLPPPPPESAPAASEPQSLPLPPPSPPLLPVRRARSPASAATERASPEPAGGAPVMPAVPAARPRLVPPRPVAGMRTHRPPVYPALARRRGEQGRVVLRVKVGLDGAPLAVAIGKSSGFAVLDRAAVDAVRGWRFHPATENGRPVQGIKIIPFQFRLTD